MEISETLYVTSRKAWRTWLKKHHAKKKEIWLIYYKKHTGKPRIPYDDAVKEALCFGWIDSTLQRMDEEKYTQKFTPRRRGSVWSQLNIKRAQKMIKEKRMTKAGLIHFKNAGKKKSRSVITRRQHGVPADLKTALTKRKKALENFNNFAPSYRKMYVLWVLDAKRAETREKRIRRVVERSAKNQKPGMM